MSEPNVQQSVPFLRVADIQASLKFYVDGLDFNVKNRWESEGQLRWCWLQAGGAAMMLQQFAPDGPGGRPPTPLGLGVSLCFMCEDALAIFHKARARGLAPRKPFVGNGLWVAGLVDPDGYRIEFESPTDAAEETEYAKAD